jgi:hypothetical protein
MQREIPELRPKNIKDGFVVLGHRHGQCIWTIFSLLGLRTCTNSDDGTGEHEQGFLTSKNRFVGREEAAIIAFDAGQIDKEKKVLYSEDLY